MQPSKGRSLPLSTARRVIVDLMRACRGIPAVTAERRMHLAETLAAREGCRARPSWCAIFAKAFALTAARMPALRRSYLSFPTPHLYEHPESIATVTVERHFENEPSVFFAQLRGPEHASLRDCDAVLRRHQHAPLESLGSCRRVLRLARTPWPIRPLLWWAGMNVRGRWRERFFGTFCISSPASFGAGMTTLIAPTTCALHYGLFEPTGHVAMRITFDHRVLDGATAARALAEMERTLQGAIVLELQGMAQAAAAA